MVTPPKQGISVLTNVALSRFLLKTKLTVCVAQVSLTTKKITTQVKCNVLCMYRTEQAFLYTFISLRINILGYSTNLMI
ncbi:hypothetical protein VcPa08_02783 [Vibrio cholerae]|nr:hypothetical protein VcPa01_02727 [Vibrio cholerae]GFK38122.1 hypothetical protein VcPa02_02730 [Vibrio cholerae]GFK41582.1 hypothetical protein VcPa03_02693 [Vibrio cholerae]GFK45130.1 hypothetical protein VcPa04_02691 [Vibrio cholerae]GFK48392.1 hypothetical protein VcPa05_02391 [Vibrio cholerae]